MALKLAGEEVGLQEKIENIVYKPGLQDSGDLESGTKVITATSEASGVGNADYSKSLTISKPDDARITIRSVASRLAVTIDSFDAATHLYCRVYVDAQDADHRLFDMDWDSTGAKLAADNWTNGTIFDLLPDGNPHMLYFFFWVNQANNAVISSVQLWEAVGWANITGYGRGVKLTHRGFANLMITLGRVGTGTCSFRISPDSQSDSYFTDIKDGCGEYERIFVPCVLMYDTAYFRPSVTTVLTDLWYIRVIRVYLRSLQ